jgi:hypothetical protein
MMTLRKKRKKPIKMGIFSAIPAKGYAFSVAHPYFNPI